MAFVGAATSALDVFFCLEVLDLDPFFLLLFLGLVSHVTFHLFVVSCFVSTAPKSN